MATASSMSSSETDHNKSARQTSKWRQKLTQLIRGQPRPKEMGRRVPVSQAPPRLGPLGQDSKRLTDSTPGINLASLQLNDGSSLGDFKLSFDLVDGGFSSALNKRDTHETSERSNGARKPPLDRASYSAAGQRPRKKNSARAPSLDLPRFDCDLVKSFYDTWLVNSIPTDTSNDENTRPLSSTSKPETKPSTEAAMTSQNTRLSPSLAAFPAAADAKRSPLSPQTTNIKIESAQAKRDEILTTRDQVPPSPTKRSAVQPMLSSSPHKQSYRNSVISSPATTPTTTPKLIGKSDAFTVRPLSRPSSARESRDSSFRRKEFAQGQQSSFPTTASGGISSHVSVASKRLSLGSEYRDDVPYRSSEGSKHFSLGSVSSATQGEAQRIEYSRPRIGPKLVNSDVAGSGTSSGIAPVQITLKKFEVKTNGLLQPVKQASADKQAESVSSILARINSHSMNPPSSGARQYGDRRVMTERVRSRSRVEVERAPTRRVSQPAIRSRYNDASASVSPAPAPNATTLDFNLDSNSRPRRSSSRLSDRMSWLRDLEDSKIRQSGREFVFRRLEGGVAAKLAAFENKAAGSGTGTGTSTGTGSHTPDMAGAGLGISGISRSNSINSRISSSDHYNIELSRRSRCSVSDSPGNISDLVDESFKKKLESMTSAMAVKIQKQAEQPEQAASSSSATRGPTNLTAACTSIPQDVLDFIVLSGVDPEVAISEYLNETKTGKSKDWQHKEVLRQINDLTHQIPRMKNPPKANKEQVEADASPALQSIATPEPLEGSKMRQNNEELQHENESKVLSVADEQIEANQYPPLDETQLIPQIIGHDSGEAQSLSQPASNIQASVPNGDDSAKCLKSLEHDKPKEAVVEDPFSGPKFAEPEDISSAQGQLSTEQATNAVERPDDLQKNKSDKDASKSAEKLNHNSLLDVKIGSWNAACLPNPLT